MEKGAHFSACRKFRYALWRKWGGERCVTFIGLNPSTADDPVGPDNDEFLQKYLNKDELNIACWGNHGEHFGRGEEVMRLLGESNLHVFGLTKKGQPKHPLYLKKDLEPVALQDDQDHPLVFDKRMPPGLICI